GGPQLTAAVCEETAAHVYTVAGLATLSIVGAGVMVLTQLAVDGHHLEFVSAKDFETDAHTYHVTVRASDGANTTDQPITVTLTDERKSVVERTSREPRGGVKSSTDLDDVTDEDADDGGSRTIH